MIGAQASYLHTGAAAVALREATKDSDLAIDSRSLGSDPLLEAAMSRANFIVGVGSAVDQRRVPSPASRARTMASARVGTLKLTLPPGAETEVDVNKDGFGAGDYDVQTGSVYLGTKKLGRLTQSCTALTLKPVPSVRCSMDLVLSRGQVTLQGSFTLSDSAPQLAVTGGTGLYEGVRGQATETGSVGHANLVTLHLLYP